MKKAPTKLITELTKNKLTKVVKQGMSESIPEKSFYVKELEKQQAFSDKYNIMHWNINGVRSVIKKDPFTNYMQKNDFDIICFNETKICYDKMKGEKLDENKLWADEYHQYWAFSTRKKGYSGCAVFSKQKPINYTFGVKHALFDSEGRTITLEYPEFFLVSCYVPNASSGLVRLDIKTKEWQKAFEEHLITLKEKKSVVVVSDLNVVHKEIDIHNPVGKHKAPGFTKEERSDFDKLLNKGFKDSWRERNPGKVQYTWWAARGNVRKENKGWRLDYCVVNDDAYKYVKDVIIKDMVYGSDHCPLEVQLNFEKKEEEKAEKETQNEAKAETNKKAEADAEEEIKEKSAKKNEENGKADN